MVTHNDEINFDDDSHVRTMMIENEDHDGDVGGGGGRHDSDDKLQSMEMIFKGKEVLSWRMQLTIRSFVVRFVLGVLFTFIAMKLNLTTGIIPFLNAFVGLLGFFFVKTWTKFLEKSGMLKRIPSFRVVLSPPTTLPLAI